PERPLRSRPDAPGHDRLRRPLTEDPDLQLPAEPRDRPSDRPDPVQPRPGHAGQPAPPHGCPDRPRSPGEARRSRLTGWDHTSIALWTLELRLTRARP